MPDLHTLMTEAAPALTSTNDADADADIMRGRRILRARRARRVLGASGTTAAVLIAGLAVAATTGGPGPSGVPGVSDGRGPAGAVHDGTPSLHPGGVELVAYHGAQPDGFILASVPSGWEIESSTPSELVLAPRPTHDSTSHDSTDWVGKLGVQLSLDATPDLNGSTLRLNGHPAVVTASGSAGARTLYVEQDHGWLVIQAWENLGWDAQRLVDFGRGIKITGVARGTGG